jgi:hypothetical protein
MSILRGKKTIIRRRPSPQQGRALEILGHSIEYLVDSYIAIASSDGNKDDVEAAEILMKLNLQIFNECPEIVSVFERLRNSLRRLRDATTL